MPLSSRSLNSYVSWGEILTELEIQHDDSVLPCSICCPLCQGSAEVHYDELTKGGWFHCTACKSSMDMIQLAGAVWKLSAEETAHRLDNMGFRMPRLTDELLARYVKDHVEKPAITNDFFARTAKGMKLGSVNRCGQIRRRLGLQSKIPEFRWTAGPGKLFGLTNHTEIGKTYYPGAMKTSKGKKLGENNSYSPFKGANWKDVLVVPFFDVPGRICGFNMVGRLAREQDKIYYCLNKHRTQVSEAGLAFVQLLEESSRYQNGCDVVAIKDTFKALSFHLRHFRMAAYPIPVVGWYEDDWHRTSYGWRILQNRKIHFWCNGTLDPQTLKQAAEQNANISLSPYSKHLPPADDLLPRIQKTSKSWAALAAKVLSGMADTNAGGLLLKARLDAIHLDEIYRHLGRSERTRIQELLDRRRAVRVTTVNGSEIVERAGKWVTTVKGKETEVLSAVLRIDQKVRQRETGRILYQGKVLKEKGPSISFSSPMEEVEDRTDRWLTGLAIQHNTDIRCPKKWVPHLTEIATRFHKPQNSECSTIVGWNETEQEMVLPEFRMDRTGRFTAESMVSPEDLPGRGLLAPTRTRLSRSTLEQLTQNTLSNQIVWATIACVVSDILAPAFGEKPLKTMLVGQTAQQLGRRTALAAGCVEMDITSLSLAKAYDQDFYRHKWPVLFTRSGSPRPKKYDVPMIYEILRKYSCLFGANAITAHLMAIEEPWRIIKAESSKNIPQGILDRMETVVAHYLRYVGDRGFRLISDQGLWFNRVAEDLDLWAEMYGGVSGTIWEAKDLVLAEDLTPKHHLFYLLSLLFEQGYLRYQREGWPLPGSPPVARIQPTTADQEGWVSLDPEDLSRALRASGAPETDLKILRAAMDCPVYQNITPQPEDGAWRFPETEWRSVIERFGSGADQKSLYGPS